jgi:hypothetical protein
MALSVLSGSIGLAIVDFVTAISAFLPSAAGGSGTFSDVPPFCNLYQYPPFGYSVLRNKLSLAEQAAESSRPH